MADVPGDRPEEPEEPDSPFAGMPFFLGGFDPSQMDLGEIMRLMQSPGPVNWAVARQVAKVVADDDPAGPLGLFFGAAGPIPGAEPEEPKRPAAELTSGQRAQAEAELGELVRAAE